MPILSIVIVNYNVRHFLEQTLRSVESAIVGLDADVYVVDNNSVDGSQEMVRRSFPWVHHIDNQENLGFAKANNQAIRLSTAKYVLLLNPDTVVQEDTFHKSLAFMEATADAGGLGVRMYDGKGRFLPESKRSLPTPWVAFYKIFGLSRLFPKSSRFGRYHLTYLDEHKTHPIEVLSGAFMLLRRTVLDEVGLLDEDYFMYGEDVDLSFRITKAGYRNYYFAETSIIHYKGESTKKGSLNYVIVFYSAMLIFARKHFAHSFPQRVFMVLIHSAIYARAALAIGRRIVRGTWLPTVEFGMLWASTLGVKAFWEQVMKHREYYPPLFDELVAPAYASIFVLYLWLMGGYRRPYGIRNLFAATALYGFLTIALISYLVPSINFSRGIALLSAGTAFFLSLTLRSLVSYVRVGTFALDRRPLRKTIVVGQPAEARRVIRLMTQELFYDCDLLGIVTVNEEAHPELEGPEKHLGTLRQLDEIVRFYQAEEIVFCNEDLSTRAIIEEMRRLVRQHLHYKIVPPQADYLVGPNTILTTGNLGLPNLHLPEYRVKKQVTDLALGVSLFLLFPITFWLYHRPLAAVKCLLEVLTGKSYLVSYIDGTQPELPRLKTGWLNLGLLSSKAVVKLEAEQVNRLDSRYARTYTPSLDFQIVWRSFNRLGEAYPSA